MFRHIRSARWLRLLLIALTLLAGAAPIRAQSQPGPLLLRDIVPGPGDADPDRLTVVGDQAFFIANAPGAGRELWATDGTSDGTRMVAEVTPGPLGTVFLGMAALPDRLLFQVESPGQYALWQSDGTAAGTTLLQALDVPFHGGMIVRGPEAFFFTYADAGTSEERYQLWRSGGTTATTAPVSGMIIRSSAAMGPWPELFGIGDHLYLTMRYWSGRFGGLSYAALDGTQVSPLVGCSYFGWTAPCTRPVAWRGELAIGTNQPRQILFAQGTETRALDLSSLPFAYFGGLASLDDALVFEAWDDAGAASLWRSDGTLAGTRRIAPLTQILTDLRAVAGRGYFFQPGTDGVRHLWQTDGTAVGTMQVTGPGGRWGENLAVGDLFAAGSRLLFFADDGIHGWELWEQASADSLPAMVADIAPGSASSAPPSTGALPYAEAVTAAGTLMWNATDPAAGHELRALAFGFAPYALPAWGGGPAAARATVPLMMGNRGRISQAVTLTLTLPPGAELLDHTLGVTPTVDGPTVLWRLAGLPPGERQALLGVALPSAPLGTVLTATVRLDAGPAVPIRLAIAHQHYLPVAARGGLGDP
ncbi:MAG TPA: hypothetical protein VGE07_28805 [Herpetosiphonaceae bacterium]